MAGRYGWEWVEAEVERTAAEWAGCAAERAPEARRYSAGEQRERERAYDRALDAVEREARRVRRFRRAREGAQERIVAAFARFSAEALGLGDHAVGLLTDDFLPVGTQLARWARAFDPELAMDGIVQACRNAWTACGLQPLLGEPVRLTPGILGYSLLYPYSDNQLDRVDLPAEEKLRASGRFRERLRGEAVAAENSWERAVWELVGLVEGQYPREVYPQVYDCLLAIHRGQEESLRQLRDGCSVAELLRVSCTKGGTSVLADACLAQPELSAAESRFGFAWGVLLQLGDDLQDIEEDVRRGSATLFSTAARRGECLDGLVIQLLQFAERVGAQMEGLAHGDAMLRDLLRMSWRSLILMAVAESHGYFSPEFLREAEGWSPFRFGFLRERRVRLAGRRGLYGTLFELFLAGEDEGAAELPAAGGGLGLATAGAT
ncbi:MAG: class 1 isoprenoid biosynthesis enzyme [Acidobacteriaceae bacterium]